MGDFIIRFPFQTWFQTTEKTVLLLELLVS